MKGVNTSPAPVFANVDGPCVVVLLPVGVELVDEGVALEPLFVAVLELPECVLGLCALVPVPDD